MPADPSVTRSTPQAPPPGRPLASLDLLRILLEDTPDGVYFKDQECRFLMISRSQARVLGLAEPQEAYGKTDHDFFAAEHADQAEADERRIMETGQPIIDKVEKETWPDGRVTWASSTKLPLRSPTGEIVGTFGISRDITARVHAEAELRSARQALQDNAKTMPGPSFMMDTRAEAFRLIEQARLRVQRIESQSQHADPMALAQLAARLPSMVLGNSVAHQLAIELSTLATAEGEAMRSFTAELRDLGNTLHELHDLWSRQTPVVKSPVQASPRERGTSSS